MSTTLSSLAKGAQDSNKTANDNGQNLLSENSQLVLKAIYLPLMLSKQECCEIKNLTLADVLNVFAKTTKLSPDLIEEAALFTASVHLVSDMMRVQPPPSDVVFPASLIPQFNKQKNYFATLAHDGLTNVSANLGQAGQDIPVLGDRLSELREVVNDLLIKNVVRDSKLDKGQDDGSFSAEDVERQFATYSGNMKKLRGTLISEVAQPILKHLLNKVYFQSLKS